MKPNDETNNANEHNMVKNPKWQEADQLAIYKRGKGVKLGSTEKQLQLRGQSGIWACNLQISSKALQTPGHATSYKFDCRYLLVVSDHVDKAHLMETVWAWQDHVIREDILK